MKFVLLDVYPKKIHRLIAENFIENIENSLSIKDLVEEIRKIIIDKFADNFIVINSLLIKGITLDNIKDYDSWRFSLNKMSFFDCMNLNFPKIIKSEIPVEISNIKYGITVSLIQEYLIKEIS